MSTGLESYEGIQLPRLNNDDLAPFIQNLIT
jgi:hypothetical protein